MRKINLLFLTPILLGSAFCVFGQEKTKNEFIADLNGNGKREHIVTVNYKKPASLLSSNNTACETRTGYFAKFVLYRDGQKRGMTIFDYSIGDDEAVYWQYRIDKAIDLNRDGKKDLIFYAGDDTTEEYVFLIQKASYFKAVYSGTLELDYFAELNDTNDIVIKNDGSPTKVLAKWNAKREVFEGEGIYWIIGNCIGLYTEPSELSKVLVRFYEGEIVYPPEKANDNQDGWQKIKVNTFEGWKEGWMEMRHLSASSPTKNFPVK